MKSMGQEPPLILCPLAHEYGAIRRHLGRDCPMKLACTGPGTRGILRWFESTDALQEGSTVILAGLGGGLTTTLDHGDVVCASEVIHEDGTSLKSPVSARNIPSASIFSSEQLVHSSSDKSTLNTRSGAEVVDMESSAFARACNARGLNWLVLRAVSDVHDEDLPHQVAHWIDDTGRARPWTITRDLLRHPTLVGDCMRMRSSSKLALDRLAVHLQALELREVTS